MENSTPVKELPQDDAEPAESLDRPNYPTPKSPVNRVRMPFWLPALFVAVLGLAAVSVVFIIEQMQVRSLTASNNLLNAQAASLIKKIKTQTDINSGATAQGNTYKDPAGSVGLIKGTITMTLPEAWMRVPQSSCTGGTIDSAVVCQDVAAVAPNSLVKSDGTAKWSVSLGVYDYSSSDGSAKDWYNNKYARGSGDDTNPGNINISTTSISGYSAYSYQYQAFSSTESDPEYTQAYYTVVHGKYAVVINVQVQAGSTYGANAFDYRKTYLPMIAQMIQTIKFQD